MKKNMKYAMLGIILGCIFCTLPINIVNAASDDLDLKVTPDLVHEGESLNISWNCPGKRYYFGIYSKIFYSRNGGGWIEINPNNRIKGTGDKSYNFIPSLEGDYKFKIEEWADGYYSYPYPRDTDVLLRREESGEVDVLAAIDKWTLMFYFCGDYDLVSNIMDDNIAVGFLDILLSRNNPDISSIILADFYSGVDKRIVKADYSINIEELDELYMASTATLRKFITWSQSNFPAENYALFIYGASSGVWSSNSIQYDSNNPSNSQITHYGEIGGICYDRWGGRVYGERLTHEEIHQAISGKNIDILTFDGSYMGSMEIVHELQDDIDYFVANEAITCTSETGGRGFPYGIITSWISINQNANSKQFAQKIVQSYVSIRGKDRYVISAYDMNIIRELKDKFAPIFNKIIYYLENDQGFFEHFWIARQNPKSQLEVDELYFDFIGLVEKYSYWIPEISEVVYTFDRARFALEVDWYHNSKGLSVYFPKTDNLFPANLYYSINYRTCSFAEETGWDNVLEVFYERLMYN